jgi:hypothetical protein
VENPEPLSKIKADFACRAYQKSFALKFVREIRNDQIRGNIFRDASNGGVTRDVVRVGSEWFRSMAWYADVDMQLVVESRWHPNSGRGRSSQPPMKCLCYECGGSGQITCPECDGQGEEYGGIADITIKISE